MRAVTVYCGSSNAIPASYMDLAEDVGRALAEHHWGLVFGGGSVGMMGRCADGVLKAGGEATGITTTVLIAMEVAHFGLTDLHVVASMHERKVLMTELGDAFLVLPGGFGTLDEAFEAITWKQLGIHRKPIVLLNADGYFEPLLAFLRYSSSLGFIRGEHLGIFTVVNTIKDAMDELGSPTPWAGPGENWWRGE